MLFTVFNICCKVRIICPKKDIHNMFTHRAKFPCANFSLCLKGTLRPYNVAEFTNTQTFILSCQENKK